MLTMHIIYFHHRIKGNSQNIALVRDLCVAGYICACFLSVYLPGSTEREQIDFLSCFVVAFSLLQYSQDLLCGALLVRSI